jgi:hypothetical protein
VPDSGQEHKNDTLFIVHAKAAASVDGSAAALFDIYSVLLKLPFRRFAIFSALAGRGHHIILQKKIGIKSISEFFADPLLFLLSIVSLSARYAPCHGIKVSPSASLLCVILALCFLTSLI